MSLSTLLSTVRHRFFFSSIGTYVSHRYNITLSGQVKYERFFDTKHSIRLTTSSRPIYNSQPTRTLSTSTCWLPRMDIQVEFRECESESEEWYFVGYERFETWGECELVRKCKNRFIITIGKKNENIIGRIVSYVERCAG